MSKFGIGDVVCVNLAGEEFIGRVVEVREEKGAVLYDVQKSTSRAYEEAVLYDVQNSTSRAYEEWVGVKESDLKMM